MQILILNGKGGSGKTTLTLGLADVLDDVKIVDLDPQKTITEGAKETGRHLPVSASNATGQHTIFDTPPYNSGELASLFPIVDLILIPAKLSWNDLLSTRSVIEVLKKNKVTKKAWLVFNEVRRPDTKTQAQARAHFKSNFPHLRIANTELGFLSAFRRLLLEPAKGKAVVQLKALIQELGIFNTQKHSK